MSALAVGLLVGFSTELNVAFAQSTDQTQAKVTTSLAVSFGNSQSNPSFLQVQRGAKLTLVNDTNTQYVFEGNGLFVAEVVLQPRSRTVVTVSGAPGTYRLQDEQGKSATAQVEVMVSSVVAPEEEKLQALASLTILEGHVRASKDLHDRGASNHGPDPDLDLKRSGKHAGHPHHELFEGKEPQAVSLQKQLRQAGVYEQLDQVLRSYMEVAGKKEADRADLNKRFQTVLETNEKARKAIAGDLYGKPEFIARVVILVMDTALGEYTTAAQSGVITAKEPGVPGNDNYIEYQDARGFLQAAYELTGSTAHPDMLQPARNDLKNLILDDFPSIDPANPNKAVPPQDVAAAVNVIKKDLESIR